MTDRPLWQAASQIAARAHCNQFRKDGCTPYVSHPVRVALTIALVFGHTEETTLAAALLHDVIEDANVDYDEIATVCGAQTADLVAAMTKDMRLVEHERERAYDEQLARAPWQARLIKLADVYDNFTDAKASPKQSRKMREKVERALKLAEGEPQLENAASIVRDLLRSDHASASAE